MIKSIRTTVGANGECHNPHGWFIVLTVLYLGIRGLYDGLTGTLLRQMTYSMMRFAVYDAAKASIHTGTQ